jgi:hypothetical protein
MTIEVTKVNSCFPVGFSMHEELILVVENSTELNHILLVRMQAGCEDGRMAHFTSNKSMTISSTEETKKAEATTNAGTNRRVESCRRAGVVAGSAIRG